MREAFATLSPLADGVQLTPGNRPADEQGPCALRAMVAAYGVERVRHHHTFAYELARSPIYGPSGAMLRTMERWSAHPPTAREGVDYERWFAHASQAEWSTEAMYPGEWLGTGAELTRAMDARMPLAIDISHLFIQRCAGALDDRTLARVLDYERVTEVHVSANDGRGDTHQPITARTFGLDWARAKLRDGTPVVYESYLHRLSDDERRAQLDLVR